MNHRIRFWIKSNIVWPVQDWLDDAYCGVRYGTGSYVAVVEALKVTQLVADVPVKQYESVGLLVSPTLRYKWLAVAMIRVCGFSLKLKGYGYTARLVDPERAEVLAQGYATFRQMQVEQAELAAERAAQFGC